MLCKRWGSTPKKSHLLSPLSTNAGWRRRGRTRRMVEQVPRRLRRSAKGRSEVAPMHGAISMRRSWGRPSSSNDDWCRVLLPGMLSISGREWLRWGVGSCYFLRVEMKGQTRYKWFVSKHGLSMQWRWRLANPRYHLILHYKWRLANPRRDDVSLPHVSFNSTLESLPLQLYSQPLTGNSFAIDRLENLFPFPVLLILSLPLFFLRWWLHWMFGWRC
jgi:hypothetical protein